MDLFLKCVMKNPERTVQKDGSLGLGSFPCMKPEKNVGDGGTIPD